MTGKGKNSNRAAPVRRERPASGVTSRPPVRFVPGGTGGAGQHLPDDRLPTAAGVVGEPLLSLALDQPHHAVDLAPAGIFYRAGSHDEPVARRARGHHGPAELTLKHSRQPMRASSEGG